jgi:predicted nicotinamide N-methyase
MSPIRVKYQTIEFETMDIHIRTLRDNQQYDDINNEAQNLGISSATWPLFGQLWPSSRVLAEHMESYKVGERRILEVGCGIALASLVLNRRCADITATDYHPEVEKFLNLNSELNHDDLIPYERTGWEDEVDTLGKFDLIIGSDLLYERDHVALLSEFIDNHANPTCEVLIVDPGRGNQSKFSKQMEELGYGYSFEAVKSSEEAEDGNFKIHRFVR